MVLSPQHLYLHLNSGQLDQQSGKWQERVITASEGGSMEIQLQFSPRASTSVVAYLGRQGGGLGSKEAYSCVVAYYKHLTMALNGRCFLSRQLDLIISANFD